MSTYCQDPILGGFQELIREMGSGLAFVLGLEEILSSQFASRPHAYEVRTFQIWGMGEEQIFVSAKVSIFIS